MTSLAEVQVSESASACLQPDPIENFKTTAWLTVLEKQLRLRGMNGTPENFI